MAKENPSDETVVSRITVRREDYYEIDIMREAGGDPLWFIQQGRGTDDPTISLPDDAAMDNFIAALVRMRKFQKEGN